MIILMTTTNILVLNQTGKYINLTHVM